MHTLGNLSLVHIPMDSGRCKYHDEPPDAPASALVEVESDRTVERSSGDGIDRVIQATVKVNGTAWRDFFEGCEEWRMPRSVAQVQVDEDRYVRRSDRPEDGPAICLLNGDQITFRLQCRADWAVQRNQVTADLREQLQRTLNDWGFENKPGDRLKPLPPTAAALWRGLVKRSKELAKDVD